jgi:DNA-binding Lrp family transcriptional regulator
MARAYVLVEMAPNERSSWLETHDGSIGLGACKGIYKVLWPNEVMLHIQCDNLDRLGEVIAHDIPKLKGVVRLTTCFFSNK